MTGIWNIFVIDYPQNGYHSIILYTETELSFSGTAGLEHITAVQTEEGILVDGITQGTVTLSENDEIVDVKNISNSGEPIGIMYIGEGGNEEIQVGYEMPFTDVPTNKHYYYPVIWAVQNGITNGATSTTFEPNALCIRGHIVTFLYRYMVA